MFLDIDFTEKPEKPQLFIAKPSGTIIGKLKESFNINESRSLSELNELSFSIPYQLDIRNELKDNPNIDKIKNRYLIKLVSGNYIEWYIINKITESSDDSGDFKEIHAFSLGYELNDKIISAYECVSYNATQVLSDVLSTSIWSIGYIDASFDIKYRSFEFPSNKALDCVYAIAEKFNALVVWDTENRLINFYKFDLYGTDKGLTITPNKYLKAIQRDSDSDEMATVFIPYGQDGLTIQRVNPTGSSRLENYSYFMYPFERDEDKNILSHSDYMSDELCNAILDYQELVLTNETTFSDLLGQKEQLQSSLTLKTNDLYDLQDEMFIILDNLDTAQAKGLSTEQIIIDRDNKQIEINNKQTEINNINTQINDIDTQILNLKTTLAIENNFTAEQIIEKNKFEVIREWRDDNYIDDEDLYNDAIIRFSEIKEPALAYELDILNFLEVVSEQRNWNKLHLGDIITVREPRLNINIKTKIIKIDFNYENADVKLIIANSKKIMDDKERFLENFYKTVSTSTVVDMSKYKWLETAKTTSVIEEILNNAWESSRRNIVAGVNESVTIDRRGITITDPTDPLKFMRFTHGTWGISADGGNTYKQTANYQGIFAERLIGQIIAGVNLTITTEDSSFTVNQNGVNISGMKLTITEGDNGLSLDTTDGLVITRSDGKVRTVQNATDGIKIQSHDGVGWVDKLYADTNGNLKVQNVDVKGNIDCDSLKIGGVDALTVDDKISVDAIEDLVVGGNVTMGANATISWDNVINQPTIPTLPEYITSTKITQTTIESPDITGGTITGGSITSNSTIDVITNAKIGEALILNPVGARSGIQWGEGSITDVPAIYYDPLGGAITIGGGSGAIYAHDQRIDVPPVAVFG